MRTRRRGVRGVVVVVVGITCWLALPSFGRAQVGSAGVGGRPAPVVVPVPALDPIHGAAFNPFLNPFAAQQHYDPQTLGLFFLQAQRARGGIGSGQLSGMNSPAVTGRRGRPAAEMPRSLAAPGAGAAGYFGRAPSMRPGRDPHFYRHNRYFSNNGRSARD